MTDKTQDNLDEKYTELGNKLIKPATVPSDFPPDFFHQEMIYGDTSHMTQAQKSAEYRRRALYSTLRGLAYDRVLKACVKQAMIYGKWVFWASLLWCFILLAWNRDKFGEAFKMPGMSNIPIIGSMFGGKSPEQQQMEQLQRQQRQLFGQ